MKIKYVIFTLILLIIYIPKVSFAASGGVLSPEDFELECTYDLGFTLTFYYADGNYQVSKSNFKLANKMDYPYSTNLTYIYKEADFSKYMMEHATCPSSVGYTVVQQSDENYGTADQKWVTWEMIFRSNNATVGEVVDDNNNKSGFCLTKVVAGFEPKVCDMIPISKDFDPRINARSLSLDTAADDPSSIYTELVAERFFFNNDVEPLHKWALKSEGSQAASKVTYIKAYQYKTANGDTIYLAEKDNAITRFANDDYRFGITPSDRQKLACFAESKKSIVTTSNDMAYQFSRRRHYVKGIGNYLSTAIELENSRVTKDVHDNENVTSFEDLCTGNTNLYIEVDWNEASESGNSATSICDIMPETALILAKVINYARFIVPAFLIILTAIDITRIVISGNLEEDLPKRKKSIIIRFIVAVTFFFLPIFVGIITSVSYGVDFGDVSCVWDISS